MSFQAWRKDWYETSFVTGVSNPHPIIDLVYLLWGPRGQAVSRQREVSTGRNSVGQKFATVVAHNLLVSINHRQYRRNGMVRITMESELSIVK